MKPLLERPVTALPGVGTARAKQYERLHIRTIEDLLTHYPRGYIDFTAPVLISEAVRDEAVVVSGFIRKKLSPQPIRRGLVLYKLILADESSDLLVTIFNSEYAFERLKENGEYLLYGKVTGTMLRREMASPQFIPAEEPAKLRPVYALTEGVSQALLQKHVTAALELCAGKLDDPIPQEISVEYALCKRDYALRNIHFPTDREAYELSRKRLVFEELLFLQLGLCLLKGRNRALTGARMHSVDTEPFCRSLPFELTGAQKRAIAEAAENLCSPYPMNRLLQGDVGSGKTAVAAALCYIARENGMQTAMMAPTELLAKQHEATLRRFLEPLGVQVALLTGSLSQRRKSLVRDDTALGQAEVVVGTHALLTEGTAFRNLGLVITDEQHRFGVHQRAVLSQKGENPHVLVMSATPIPRTLALIIYGDLDISVLDELPGGRLPVLTYTVDSGKRARIYAFIRKHVEAGRQAYIVCPTIEDNGTELASVNEYAAKLAAAELSGIRVGLLHGKLSAVEKEDTMRRFRDGEISVLVSTTVVEVGVDVPNAVVMLIENAERFGLSQLHQLRGRVGRGEHQSYCILLSDNRSPENRARLEAMRRTNDGFAISEEDLRLRGPGDFFGNAQHGLPPMKIADMSADMGVLRETQALAKRLAANEDFESRESYCGLRRLVTRLFGDSQTFQ